MNKLLLSDTPINKEYDKTEKTIPVSKVQELVETCKKDIKSGNKTDSYKYAIERVIESLKKLINE